MLKANCARAKADHVRPIEILELLQVGHCSNIGTDSRMNRRMQFSARPET